MFVAGVFFDLFIRTSLASIQIVSSCLRCCNKHLENLCEVTIRKSHFVSGGQVSYLSITCITNFFFMAWSFERRCFCAKMSFTQSWPGGSSTVRCLHKLALLCTQGHGFRKEKTHFVSCLCISHSTQKRTSHLEGRGWAVTMAAACWTFPSKGSWPQTSRSEPAPEICALRLPMPVISPDCRSHLNTDISLNCSHLGIST